MKLVKIDKSGPIMVVSLTCRIFACENAHFWYKLKIVKKYV